MRHAIAVALTLALAASQVDAQGIRQRIKKGTSGNQVVVDQSNNSQQRNDLEGAIWEWKVMDAKEKKTLSSGKLRIKSNAAFALPSGTKDGKNRELAAGGDPAAVRGAIAQRIQAKTESDTGGERIGDVVKDKGAEVTIRFDEDDEHFLSGIAVVQPDTKKEVACGSGVTPMTKTSAGDSRCAN